MWWDAWFDGTVGGNISAAVFSAAISLDAGRTEESGVVLWEREQFFGTVITYIRCVLRFKDSVSDGWSGP